MMATSARRATRRARSDAIRDAAIVREHLGQAADHRRLPDSQHEIRLFDRAADRLGIFRGATLAATLRKARREQSR